MIQLTGPGGAGKTTLGAALAARLDLRFVDLDAAFAARHGDISAYIDTHGYEAYAERNVGVYLELARGGTPPDVVALASGFMTYPDSIHPEYCAVRLQIASSPLTFVLMPSPDVDTCVREIVRRQLRRPFARSAEREEHVIRHRHSVYLGLPARRVNTMQPIHAAVTQLAAMVLDRAAEDVSAIRGVRAPC
jgi:shikimate kinase